MENNKIVVRKLQVQNMIDVYEKSMNKFKQYDVLIKDIESGNHRTRQYKDKQATQDLLDKRAGFAADAAYAEMMVKRYSIALIKLNYGNISEEDVENNVKMFQQDTILKLGKDNQAYLTFDL